MCPAVVFPRCKRPGAWGKLRRDQLNEVPYPHGKVHRRKDKPTWETIIIDGDDDPDINLVDNKKEILFTCVPQWDSQYFGHFLWDEVNIITEEKLEQGLTRGELDSQMEGPKRRKISHDLQSKCHDYRCSDLSENIMFYSSPPKIFQKLGFPGFEPNIQEGQVRNVQERLPDSKMIVQAACTVSMDTPEPDGTPNRGPEVGEVKEYPPLTADMLQIDASNELNCKPSPSGIRRGRKCYIMVTKQA